MTAARALWAVAAIAAAAACGGRDSEPAAQTTTAEDPERARLVRFWSLFQEATESRLAGHCEQAIGLYREALTIDAVHEDSLFYLGHCLAHGGAYDDALASWRRLVEVQPHAKRGFTELGLLLSSIEPGAPFDLDAARAAFEEAFAMNPEESGSMLHLAELAVATGATDEARSLLVGVERSNPRSVAAPFLLGYLDWSAGERDDAVSALARAATRLEVEREHAPSFEGQTEAGATAMTARGTIERSLLGAFWAAWSSAHEPAGAVTADEATKIYAAIEAFLTALRDGGPDQARPLRPSPALGDATSSTHG